MMFHVKNGKCIHRISFRSLRRNKVRNIVAILAVILTTVMFTSLFTIAGGMIQSMQDETCRQVGTSAHAGFKYLTWEQYERIEADPKVKDCSYDVLIALGENEELRKIQTEIRFSTEKNAEWSYHTPMRGRMPKNGKEAAVSDEILEALGVPCELGSELTLEFSVRGEKHRDTFTLCGFWEQDTMNKAAGVYVSEEYMQAVAPMWHDGDSYAKSEPSIDEAGGCVNASLWFASSWDIEGQTEALKERCGFDSSVNEGVNWAYAASSLDAGSILMIAAFLLIIAFSGYLIIYNVFYISVSGDIRFYGLLKTIGSTNRQLAKIVRRQALLLSAVGIPFGLAIGYLLGAILLPQLMSMTTYEGTIVLKANPYIFIGSAIFTLATVYLGCLKPCSFVKKISPIEAIRYTENSGIMQHGIKKKSFKNSGRVTPLAMAFQNMKRSHRKTAAVIASLSLSMVLLNTTVTLVNGFDHEKYLENYAVSDFCISAAELHNPNILTDGESTDGITPEVMEDIEQLSGVEKTGYVYFGEYVHSLSAEALERAESFYEEYKEEFHEYMREQAEEELRGGFLYSHIYGVSGIAEEKLELTSGSFEREKFESGDYVIVTGFSDTGEEQYYEIGEKVTLDFGNGKQKSYEVMAIGDVPYALGPQHGHGMDIYFTLPVDEYIAQTESHNAITAAFDVDETAVENVEAQMAAYCENSHPELEYVSRAIYEAEFEQTKQVYLLVGGVLSLLLALIGILNFVNAFITSIQARKNELAVMQSVGMTYRQLRTMLIGEGLSYILLTALIVLTAGTALTYLLVKAFSAQMWMFSYHFVIWPILLMIPILALISLLVPAACCRLLKRSSIVERLRTE